MPYGARTSLAALILLFGVGGASAEPAAGTTWTDPPVHKPAAEKPPAANQKAAAPAATASTASTPAAATPAVRPSRAARKAVAARRAPERKVARSTRAPRRVVASARRARVAAAPVRTFHAPRVVSRFVPQVVAVAPPPPPEGYPRYRPYGYGPGYAPGYVDERLDRLSSAEAAGYLVVRRRTVQFPDGRTLRVYRPDDAGEAF